MTTPSSAPGYQPEPDNTLDYSTDSQTSAYFYDDGPGDTTVRPVPPNIPMGWYPRPEYPLRKPENQPPVSPSPRDGITPEPRKNDSSSAD